MTKPLFSIDEFLQQASSVLPGEPFRQGLQKNSQALLQAALAKLDVVSREEFDVQAEKLQRCQEKLATLEAQLAELSDKP